MPDLTHALIAAIMHSTEPMVLSDPKLPDHPLIAVNPAFEAMSLYPAAETIGRNCRFLQGEGTKPAATARLRHCIEAQTGCVEWVVNYRRDGTRFWNLLFLMPVFARDGTLLHYLGNQRDISEGTNLALPDYALGRAQLSIQGELDFQALLLDLLEERPAGEDAARQLEHLVEAARVLDQITTGLAPAPWQVS